MEVRTARHWSPVSGHVVVTTPDTSSLSFVSSRLLLVALILSVIDFLMVSLACLPLLLLPTVKTSGWLEGISSSESDSPSGAPPPPPPSLEPFPDPFSTLSSTSGTDAGGVTHSSPSLTILLALLLPLMTLSLQS